MYIQRFKDKDGNYTESYEDYSERRRKAKQVLKYYLSARHPFNVVPRKRAQKR